MEDTKYTPGPWAVGYASPEKLETSTLSVWTESALNLGSGHVICKVSPEATQDETDIANAHLIAAAPELLEALIMANAYIKRKLEEKGYSQFGLEVIEKATMQNGIVQPTPTTEP